MIRWPVIAVLLAGNALLWGPRLWREEPSTFAAPPFAAAVRAAWPDATWSPVRFPEQQDILPGQYLCLEADGGDVLSAFAGFFPRHDSGGGPHDPRDCYPTVAWEVTTPRRTEVFSTGGKDGDVAVNLLGVRRDGRERTAVYWTQPGGHLPRPPHGGWWAALWRRLWDPPRELVWVRIELRGSHPALTPTTRTRLADLMRAVPRCLR